MNIKATPSLDDVARACAEAMWREDDASKGLMHNIKSLLKR